MMNGFGKEEEFEDQPKLKIIFDDGREVYLKGLAGVMITEDGDYNTVLFGHYTLPRLSVVSKLFANMMEDATDELVAEIQQEIRKDAESQSDEGEVNLWDLINIEDLLPPDFENLFQKKTTQIVPKKANTRKPRTTKKDPFTMDTWKTDKLPEDNYKPQATEFGEWIVDENGFFRKKDK